MATIRFGINLGQDQYKASANTVDGAQATVANNIEILIDKAVLKRTGDVEALIATLLDLIRNGVAGKGKFPSG